MSMFSNVLWALWLSRTSIGLPVKCLVFSERWSMKRPNCSALVVCDVMKTGLAREDVTAPKTVMLYNYGWFFSTSILTPAIHVLPGLAVAKKVLSSA